MLAASAALLTMAVAFAAASLTGAGLAPGAAGATLARLLAAAAAAAAFFGLVVGFLLGGEGLRGRGLALPLVVGVALGGAQTVLLFIPIQGPLALLPWLLLPLALPAFQRFLGGPR